MRRDLFSLLAACAVLGLLLVGMPGAASAGDPLAEARLFCAGADEAGGKLIYLAGYNLKVERIQFMGGPQWLQMHGGSCASCHGPGGRGGMFPLQCDLRTPAVDFAALAGAVAGKDRKSSPYTVATLRRTLEQSRDADGRTLDPCMPRWYPNDVDYRDLTAHLLHLSGR